MNGAKTKKQSKVQNPESRTPKICLTIAGLDPSGGAGIIADIKTFTAFGCFATAAIASVTFQNTTGVFGAVHQTAKTVCGQVEPILRDFEIAAVKTGMLPTRSVIKETARIIKEYKLKNLVVDPVVRSTSGFDLIDGAALQSLVEKLFPLAKVVTPNLPEAARIANLEIKSEKDIEKAARTMQSFGAKNVLIKGGHILNADCRWRAADLKNCKGRAAKDYLFVGSELHVFEAEFIETDATHGTGCTLAAAIAANLALGKNLIEAVRAAKKFVTAAIRAAPDLGRGHSPVNHSVSDF